MNISALFKSLCLPAKVYLVLSIVGVLITLFIGGVSVLTQLIHLLYIVFWVWILNVICKSGYKVISWILVLLPFVLMFLLFTFVLGEVVHDEREIANKTAPVIVLNK